MNSVKEILDAFGLSEFLDSFEANDIDLEAFNLLHKHPTIIKEVIPSVGKRLKFIERYNKYIAENITSSETQSFEIIQVQSPSSASTTTVASNTTDAQGELEEFLEVAPPKRPCLEENALPSCSNNNIIVLDFDENLFKTNISIFPESLEKYLESNSEGTLLLLSKNQLLNPLKQKKLTRIIVDFLLSKYKEKIPQVVFQQVAKEITTVFIKESEEVYFRPYKSSLQKCSGKLWSRYINVKKSYNVLKKSTTAVPKNMTEKLPQASSDERDQYALEFCKFNISPMDEVECNWGICYDMRIKMLKNGMTVDEFLQTFPILKQPQGFVLLLHDFEKCHPLSNNALYTNWTQFRNAVHGILTEEGIPSKFNDIDMDVLFNFPLIFPPTTVRVREKKSFRPSKLEVQNSFMAYVANAADLHVEIQRRKEYSQSRNITLQPFMLISGNADTYGGYSFYCVVNDTMYSTETVVKTLDTTFKVMYALDLKYQVECQHVWACIQKFLYNIDTHNEKFSISTDTVISKIKNKLNTS